MWGREPPWRLPRGEKLRFVDAPEVRYTKSGDISIAYSTVGDGPFDLVFVAGWVLSVFESAWDGPAADTLSRLASFSRLILFDKRGTGLSDRSSGIPDLETRMDEIRAVMDAVGSKRAALLGVSEGGPMTLLFAATYPDRTAAAILYGTGASFKRSEEYPWALSPEEWRAVIEGSDHFGTKEWLDETLEVFSPSIAHDEEMKRWWRRWVLASTSPGALEALQHMNMNIDVRHVLSSISSPTLVLHPADDSAQAVEEGSDRLPNGQGPRRRLRHRVPRARQRTAQGSARRVAAVRRLRHWHSGLGSWTRGSQRQWSRSAAEKAALSWTAGMRLDNGQRSPKKLLRAVVAGLLGRKPT